MSHVVDVLAVDLDLGDMIDLSPLVARSAAPLTEADKYAVTDGYATITALSEHGGFVDIVF